MPDRVRGFGVTPRGAVRIALLLVFLWWWLAPRPEFLPLSTQADGPELPHATTLVLYLHGRGESLPAARRMAAKLRAAGLSKESALVLVEAPFSNLVGHAWGTTPRDQAISRRRIRSLLDDLLKQHALPPSRVIVAGFSQGAGIALDVAAEDLRVGNVASFSPCQSLLRGTLSSRDGLRLLLVHGKRDTRCPAEESASLARVLELVHKPVRYLEFDGGHDVPPSIQQAFAEFVASVSSTP